MLRKLARMTAVVAMLTLLGAASASAMDDDQVRAPSPGPVSLYGGIYGYDSTSGQWIVWDVYRLPNGQTQRRCHPAGQEYPKTAC